MVTIISRFRFFLIRQTEKEAGPESLLKAGKSRAVSLSEFQQKTENAENQLQKKHFCDIKKQTDAKMAQAKDGTDSKSVWHKF